MARPPAILAADVGGTNCRLSLFHGAQQVATATAPTGGAFADAAALLLLDQVPDAACVAVAGPVADGRATLTNQGQAFDAAALSEQLHCPVAVINDFQAATRGVTTLGPDDSRALSGPAPAPRGGVVALGPGTGLGLGWMVPTDAGWHVAPTEAGHQDFAPADPDQAALWAWLHDRHGHVSWERVLSGDGLVALHDHTVGLGLVGVAVPTATRIADSDAPACRHARQLFARCLGAFAGNCALAHLPAGGVWICGGVTPRLSDPDFDAAVVQAYADKGRFESLVAGIPLALVTAQDLGLRGAAAWARGLLPAS